MNPAWLKVNLVRELRESCPVRFWEIGLQSWQISKNNGWVPTFRGDGTHWVFLATPWFFAWTQLEWRSIQWESYVNPVLCVFEKLAYKVGIFHKVLAEFLRFVLAVLIEFSLRHPGSLHEHSLTEGQSSEGVRWILTGQKHTFPPPWDSMWVCTGNVLNSANYLDTIRFHLHTQ